MIGFEGQVVDQQHQSDAHMQSPMASREDTRQHGSTEKDPSANCFAGGRGYIFMSCNT